MNSYTPWRVYELRTVISLNVGFMTEKESELFLKKYDRGLPFGSQQLYTFLKSHLVGVLQGKMSCGRFYQVWDAVNQFQLVFGRVSTMLRFVHTSGGPSHMLLKFLNHFKKDVRSYASLPPSCLSSRWSS